MFLMDCRAQIELAKMIGRTDAVATLQTRFDEVNAQMPQLWSEAEGFFQNKQSGGDMAPVDRMAPTNFYPLLVGPETGPTEKQVATTIARHLTNLSRFGVWPGATPPTDHPMPPPEARALVQWYSHKCARGAGCPSDHPMPHQLCCKIDCNAQGNFAVGGYIPRLHGKIRFEGLGLPAVPADGSTPVSTLIALYSYNCTGLTPNVQQLRHHGWPCGMSHVFFPSFSFFPSFPLFFPSFPLFFSALDHPTRAPGMLIWCLFCAE